MSRSLRARAVEAMFDVPPQKKCRLEWRFTAPLEAEPWSIGLIVGPSGSGKSTVLSELFGQPHDIAWKGASVIDDFPADMGIEEVTTALSCVGFNTVPAWLRPFHVLSCGEKFRVEMARRLVERDLVIVDEFTSVVDRTVAKVGCHAIQKYVRRAGKRLVAAACHFDIVEWLQPDWTIEPAKGPDAFARRSVRRRPSLDVVIQREAPSVWTTFAPYHYLTARMPSSARVFVARVGGQPAAVCVVNHQQHPSALARSIRRVSRLVTLPDYQGLGLAFVLLDAIGSAYARLGFRFRTYPNHPALIDSMRRSASWAFLKRSGLGVGNASGRTRGSGCAVFEFVGKPSNSTRDALDLLGDRP